MDIAELMSQPILSCSSDDNLNRAAQLMWEHDCGALPVVDEAGKLQGLITDRDICMAAFTQGATLNAIPVTQAMSHKVISCKQTDSIENAEQLMRDNQVRRLPIVDEHDRPVGLLSLGDLARAAVSTKQKRTSLNREVAETLAAIATPRSGNGRSAPRI